MTDVLVDLLKTEIELKNRIHVLEQHDAEIRSTLKNLQQSIKIWKAETNNMQENQIFLSKDYNDAITTWNNNFKTFTEMVIAMFKMTGHAMPDHVINGLTFQTVSPPKIHAVKRMFFPKED